MVSTKRKNYETFPRSALLAELGRRVLNVRNYQQALGNGASQLPKFTEFEKPWLGSPQPLRTDCENALSGIDFVDVGSKAEPASACSGHARVPDVPVYPPGCTVALPDHDVLATIENLSGSVFHRVVTDFVGDGSL